MQKDAQNQKFFAKLPPLNKSTKLLSNRRIIRTNNLQTLKTETMSNNTTKSSLNKSISQTFIVKKSQSFKDEMLNQMPKLLEQKLIFRFNNYLLFLQFINYSNNLRQNQNLKYPYYVCINKGNNHYLIQHLFKTRWWWKEVEPSDLTKINLQWSQIKNNELLSMLTPYPQDKETKTNIKDFYQLILNQKIMKKLETAEYQSLPSWIKKILNKKDICLLLSHMEKYQIPISQLNSVFNQSDLNAKELKYNSQSLMHNHLEDNWNLGNKKALFYNMRKYYQANNKDYFDYMPVTFHIQNGEMDKEYLKLTQFYNSRKSRLRDNQKNMWIVKPGENTNRGNGITVCHDLTGIKSIISLNDKHPNGKPVTYIVQLYIDNPLLYYQRKFDIRCFMLVTSVNGILKAYWYDEGYIRTSSKEFNLTKLDVMIHLTNDAVQKNDQNYGKYESGNKVSFQEFQRYLDKEYKSLKINFYRDLYSQMESIAQDTIKACHNILDPNRRSNSFEVRIIIFGLDFMIDQNLKVYLIEVNTNPCLEQSSPLLNRIIPMMVENALRISVDSQFSPPGIEEWQNGKFLNEENMMESNRFKLVFDESLEKIKLKELRERMERINDHYELGEIDDEN